MRTIKISLKNSTRFYEVTFNYTLAALQLRGKLTVCYNPYNITSRS